VLLVLLVLQFAEVRNHAEETVSVVTDWQPTSAHPIYLIAASPQEKMAPRPLNVPIVSARRVPAKNSNQNPIQATFSMLPAQAARIGNGLIQDAEFQMALVYFEDAKNREPHSLDVLTGLARCYYELGRDSDALTLYTEAIALNPSLWESQFYLGRIHLENGRYAQAIEALENALKLKPDDANTISGLGVALSKAGRTADAINYLTRVTALKRYIKEDFYYLGEAYASEQQWLKAAQTFKDGADLYGTDPNGYFYWATMLFNADKLDEAFEAYLKVKSVDTTASHSGAARYMAEIFRLRGKLAEALGQYQLLLRREPNDTEALFQAGYISFKLNQLDQAKDFFRKLIEVDPKHAGGAANYVALEARYNEIHIGRNEKTLGITLREVVQANPNSVEAHVNLGAQLITEKVYPEALTILERAVSLQPNSAAAQYDLGLAQLKAEKFEEAVASNRKALELKPDWPDAYNNLGLAFAGLRRWEEAATAYREAMRVNPNYSGALYNLGIAYLRLQQKPATLQVVEKLKQLSFPLQALLSEEIRVSEPTAKVIATPPPQPSPSVAEPTPTTNGTPDLEECPSPIYRASGVTQMASIAEPVQVSYTTEAEQNKVEGKIVLQMVICSNGRVSDITVDESLPFGLTERAVEALKKVKFKPALLDSRPVSVLMKQTFACAQQVCTSMLP
jgi:TonB family protein